jgi:hypothetical protein
MCRTPRKSAANVASVPQMRAVYCAVCATSVQFRMMIVVTLKPLFFFYRSVGRRDKGQSASRVSGGSATQIVSVKGGADVTGADAALYRSAKRGITGLPRMAYKDLNYIYLSSTNEGQVDIA